MIKPHELELSEEEKADIQAIIDNGFANEFLDILDRISVTIDDSNRRHQNPAMVKEFDGIVGGGNDE